MVIITHYRKKCIGCNSCVELAFDQWRMSRKDGKSVLLSAENKREVYTLRIGDEYYEENLKAAEACPVNIIKVKIK